MGRRRGNGEGSIHQRSNGLWVGQIDLGRGPDGKRRRQTVYGKTRKEVAEKLNQLLAARQSGLYVEPTKWTVGEYLQHWLQNSTSVQTDASTHESYEAQLRRYVIPTIGHIPLQKLSPVHVQEMQVELLERGLSKRTVQYAKSILNTALNEAVRLQLIPRNPAAAVKSPRPDPEEMQVLDQEQVAKFLAHVKEHPTYSRWYPFFLLALSTGLRKGELLGLRWQDVDLDGHRIYVRQQLIRVRHEYQFVEPKSKHSKRTVTISSQVVEALRQHRLLQAQERWEAQQAGTWTEHGLVFTTPTGKWLDPFWVTHLLQKLLKEAGLPVIRFHDLRHTHATLLLLQGVNVKIVSERLGHSSVSFTLDKYGHLLPDMGKMAAEALDDILFNEAAVKDIGVTVVPMTPSRRQKVR